MQYVDCDRAEKHENLCLGYSGDTDEPCEQCSNCIKCESGTYQLGETEKDDQLTKAREIIKDLLEYSKEHCLYSDIKKQAEQFLNSEVEKMTEQRKQKGMKVILDVTCGSRQIWFNKKEPHTIYCDRRKEEYIVETSNGGTKKIIINPDVVADFTSLPFEDNTFNLVIFDPPHAKPINENSLLYKEYTDLRGDWHTMLKKGFEECMRVLKVNGIIIFKWSDVHYSTREVINAIGTEPLFGHRSGKKMNTHWMCFMKFASKE